MAPSATSRLVDGATESVRARVLTALHLGKLRPGDRVLSVRRLAHVTGVNPKAVHRAYRTLVEEGYLEVRPGSGTFVCSASTRRTSGEPTESDLLSTLNRCRAEALRLGLTPLQFAGFLDRGLGERFRSLRLAVVECNQEQIGWIGTELEAGLGLEPVPVLLRELRAEPRRSLRTVSGVVTTDCHRVEVSELVDPLGVPLYRVALDPRFPDNVARHARQGAVVLIVRDDAFGPVFLRLLRQMSVVPQVAARVRVVNLFQAQAALAEAGPEAAVYLSPLVEEVAARMLFIPQRRIEARWHVERSSLDRLQASLAFDCIQGRHALPALG